MTAYTRDRQAIEELAKLTVLLQEMADTSFWESLKHFLREWKRHRDLSKDWRRDSTGAAKSGNQQSSAEYANNSEDERRMAEIAWEQYLKQSRMLLDVDSLIQSHAPALLGRLTLLDTEVLLETDEFSAAKNYKGILGEVLAICQREIGSELPSNSFDHVASKDDKKSDKEKKSKPPRRSPRRPMTAQASECAAEYRRLIRIGDKKPMESVVAGLATANDWDNESTVIRVLNDNPEQWKIEGEDAAKKRQRS